tara:strand:+ start:988 stop:1212 length:225 start_codon:yes stop_codon:yes gene_type:complete
MIDKKHFDSLKLLENELQVAILKYERDDELKSIIYKYKYTLIEDLKEALEHISRAIDIMIGLLDEEFWSGMKNE